MNALNSHGKIKSPPLRVESTGRVPSRLCTPSSCLADVLCCRCADRCHFHHASHTHTHTHTQVLDKYEDIKLGELHGIDAKKVGKGRKKEAVERRGIGGGNRLAHARGGCDGPPQNATSMPCLTCWLSGSTTYRYLLFVVNNPPLLESSKVESNRVEASNGSTRADPIRLDSVGLGADTLARPPPPCVVAGQDPSSPSRGEVSAPPPSFPPALPSWSSRPSRFSRSSYGMSVGVGGSRPSATFGHANMFDIAALLLSVLQHP